MLSPQAAKKALSKVFRSNPVADRDALFRALGTTSRMSMFRRLKEVGYLSSYTHAGRYYTLADLPDFDEHGLWFRRGIGFSQAGTLKETVAVLVQAADAGCTHPELEFLVRVQVHNALLGLVREQRLVRERIGQRYLYLSADAGRRAEQLERRHALVAGVTAVAPLLPTEVVIAVLVEALHASEGLAPSAVVAARLAVRGQDVSTEQVARIYAEYRLVPGKKTVEPP